MLSPHLQLLRPHRHVSSVVGIQIVDAACDGQLTSYIMLLCSDP